jgi:hypothetical protein
MGKCIRCGVQYCNCPTDGICPNCTEKEYEERTGKKVVPVSYIQSNPKCGYTVDKLQVLKERCEGSSASLTYLKIGMTQPQMNDLLSYILSAWNYRSNPCMFINDLARIESFVQLLDVAGL